MMILKTIEGYENYQVSDTGIVINKKTGRVLKQREKKGYMEVYIFNKGKRKMMLVHRLVAQAFIPNPNNYPQINHKDENSKNNNVDNLEWCTQKYNNNYGTYRERARKRMLENNPFKGKHHTEESKEKMRLAKLGKPSKRKRKVIIDGIEYESVANAMQELKISTKKLYKLLDREKERK